MVYGPQEVVISGIGGRFPECRSVDELKEKLYSKTNLIQPDASRKLSDFSEDETHLTSRKIPDWNRYDNLFFGIPSLLVKHSDPIQGMLMETTYEAILDAGINPFSLKGHKIAVFGCPSLTVSETISYVDGVYIAGVGLVGNSRAMLANRISYCFDFTGPSYATTMSWDSAMTALHRAANLVSAGLVEAAVVTSANSLLISSFDLEYRALGFLAKDGLCHPFDANGHGFVRSEAAVTFYIQRQSDAKRSYGTIRVGTEFVGNKDCSFLQMNPHIDRFFRDFYKNENEKPEDVAYIEAHGICIKDADEAELNAMASVFCSQEKPSQLIGSVYGNIGHCECSSGPVAMVKAILAMETGLIPPTINYATPNPNIPALVNGKLKPVTEVTELTGDLVGVNNVHNCGSFSHVLLKRHSKVKKPSTPQSMPEDGLPRLVLLQARHQEGAKAICEKVTSMDVDVEFVALANEAFRVPISAYLWRGYTIVPAPEEKGSYKTQVFEPSNRTLWFIFSGMGSQWPGMGRDLLKIPVVAASIEKCDKILRPKGLDIVHILSTQNNAIFDNILHCFVGITAIQIALVDLLKKLKITPDGIIGHSVGELGCAYADGCFTAEETILAAYARGKASLEGLASSKESIRGMMAAIGLGYEEIKDKLPPSIDVACHNSKESCTLSGPTEDVLNFVDKLKSSGVFARAVSAGGIAYHSRYIRSIGSNLLEYLKEVVSSPKPRSSKWISTSVPESQWNTEAARFCSPQYHTNNLLNSVYFEEGCKHIPSNAILVEIAPHGLLQAILRRSISAESLNVSMTSRSAGNNLYHLSKTLGELYLNNVDMDINALYPTVEYPVSRNTPSLASLATWNHEELQYVELQCLVAMRCNTAKGDESIVHPSVPEYRLWKEHKIRGQVVLPISQILMYPWGMILSSRCKNIEECYTIIEDVAIKSHIFVDEVERKLQTSFSPAALRFEVVREEDDVEKTNNNVLSGRLVVPPEDQPLFVVPELAEDPSNTQVVSESEIYSMLTELGCELGPQFQLIKKLYIGKKECLARVQWTGNLVNFLDSLFKIVIIFKSREKGVLLHPNSFNKLTVNSPYLMSLPKGTELDVHYQSWSNTVLCSGAELLGLSLSTEVAAEESRLTWSELKFQPYCHSKSTVDEFLSSSVQTAAEDSFLSWKDSSCSINILVIRTDDDTSSQYMQMLKRNFMCRSDIDLKISEVDVEKAKEQVSQSQRHTFIVAGEYSALANLIRCCGNNLYCITYFSNNGTPKHDQTLRLISVHQTDSGRVAFLKKVTPQTKFQVCKLQSSEWLNDLRSFVERLHTDQMVVAVTEDLTPRQVLPTISNEPFAYRIRTFFIQDSDAPQFSQTSSFYSSQLSLGLCVNILRGGVWGSLRTTSPNIRLCNFNLDNLIMSTNPNLAINCVGLNTTTFSFYCGSSVETELKYVDYSGTHKGQRVMGVASIESKSNTLCPDPILRWAVPAGWTLEDAASVPVVYALAYYCVKLKAAVETGEHMLVHAGMSPFGQAVIAVGLQAGARVLASVMDEEEVLLLTEQFPTLKNSQVFVIDKEDINVAVRKRTGGKGVEVIINCLRGNYFQSTMRTADSDCRILHLAEIKIEDREIIGLSTFFGNRSAYGITLANIEGCTDEWKTEIRNAIKNGVIQGVVKPLKKRSFPLHELPEALRNLKINNANEKTVVVSKYEDQILPQSSYFKGGSDTLHIVAGPNTYLKAELAEWLIHHGSKKLILLNDEESIGSRYMKRVTRILTGSKCSIIIFPSSHLDNIGSALQFLEDALRIGTVSSIFCVGMDENSHKMKNLDSASRQLLPGLQQFVSLLGNGKAVSDSRDRSGLPACSIKSKGLLESPSSVLPYLFSLLNDTKTKQRFFFVSDTFNTVESQGDLESLSYLPNSIEDLYTLGSSVEADPSFVEEDSRSPGFSVVKYCLLPVFVIPGLGRHSLKPLLRQLIHPVFCCSIPAESQATDELAQRLIQDILKIRNKGPYNIVGESWGGALALTIARLLEAQGHRVNLILIQAIPTVTQSRLQALCKKFDADIGNCLLNVALNTQAKESVSWSERLTQLVETLEPDVRQPVSMAVTALNNQLTSLLQFKPSKPLYKGPITLIKNKNDHLRDLENLSKVCQASPKIVTIDENNHSKLVASFTTASAVNENMAFEWWL